MSTGKTERAQDGANSGVEVQEVRPQVVSENTEAAEGMPEVQTTGLERRRWSEARDVERFWASIQKTGGCWLWTRALSSTGYGVAVWKRSGVSAHRLSYQLVNGEMERGRHVHHKCGNRRCVNPEHLTLVPEHEHTSSHGTQGGKARAEKLTKAQRKEIAKKAADARWNKTPAKD